MKITVEVLNKLNKIKGDFYNYVSFLKDKFLNSTYGSMGNELTYKNSKGFSYKKTYDSQGDILTCKDSYGLNNEYTYKYKNNKLYQVLKDNKVILEIPEF